MNTLYSILYPCKEIAKVNELYFRGQNYTIDPFAHEIKVQEKNTLSFCTYYNSFSLNKWRKYTNLTSLLLELRLKGSFRVDIYTRYLTAGDYLEKLLVTTIINNDLPQESLFDVSEYINYDGLLYFEITALTPDCVFYSGKYKTQQNIIKPNIGICICTYRREQYIKKYIENFELYNLNSNLYTFISDNGNTLPNEWNGDRIFIFKNKNYGGAGGFTRGLLEVKKHNQISDQHISYIVLMDDDIVIDFNIFERLSSFLALRKPEYENYFVAGSMCSLDYPFLQYEKTASWRGDHFIQSGASYDLRDINLIVTNEREDKLNRCSAGWWFSCFSEKMVTPNNYPFPCFFRGDDMEFTIRNGSKIISLNGINVWHEPFYKKYSIVSENYYLYRNGLVINALYNPEFGFRNTIKYLGRQFIINLVKYDYRSAELIIKALDDYCKGVVFFETTNPEELNKELSKYNYLMSPINQDIEEYRFEDLNYNIYQKADKSKLGAIIRHLTFNGYLIPQLFFHPFDFALVGFGARYINFYKTKKVYNYDPFAQKGYFTSISKRKALKLTLAFFKRAIFLKKNFNQIQSDYQSNFWKIQTVDFWKKYLNI